MPLSSKSKWVFRELNAGSEFHRAVKTLLHTAFRVRDEGVERKIHPFAPTFSPPPPPPTPLKHGASPFFAVLEHYKYSPLFKTNRRTYFGHIIFSSTLTLRVRLHNHFFERLAPLHFAMDAKISAMAFTTPINHGMHTSPKTKSHTNMVSPITLASLSRIYSRSTLSRPSLGLLLIHGCCLAPSDITSFFQTTVLHTGMPSRLRGK